MHSPYETHRVPQAADCAQQEVREQVPHSGLAAIRSPHRLVTREMSAPSAGLGEEGARLGEGACLDASDDGAPRACSARVGSADVCSLVTGLATVWTTSPELKISAATPKGFRRDMPSLRCSFPAKGRMPKKAPASVLAALLGMELLTRLWLSKDKLANDWNAQPERAQEVPERVQTIPERVGAVSQ